MQQKAHWNSTASRVQEAILATATGLPNKDGDDDDDDDDAADDDPDPDGGCGTRVVVAVAGVTIVVGVSELLLASTAAEKLTEKIVVKQHGTPQSRCCSSMRTLANALLNRPHLTHDV